MTRDGQSFDPHPDTRGEFPRSRDRVVSARLNTDLVEQLDALAQHTGRSRGFYLRAAIEEMLPVLRERYWTHDVETRQAQLSEYNRFMTQLGLDTNEGPEG